MLRKFTRVWCVQESVVNKNTCVVQGKYGLQWELVLVAASWMGQRGAPRASIPKVGVKGRLACDRVNNIKYGTMVEFTQLLEATRTFESTEPLDNVYALLGLVEHLACYTYERKPVLHIIRPDYKRPIEEVYAQAMYIAMERSIYEPLLFVRWAQHNRMAHNTRSYRSKLPSWVADLNIQATAIDTTSGMKLPENHGVSDGEDPVLKWEASDPKVLQVDGVVFSSVSSHGKSWGQEVVDNTDRTASARRLNYIWDLAETDLEFVSAEETLTRFALASVTGYTNIESSLLTGRTIFQGDEPSDETFLKYFAALLLNMRLVLGISEHGVWETSRRALVDRYPKQASWVNSADSMVKRIWPGSKTTQTNPETSASESSNSGESSKQEKAFKLVLEDTAGKVKESRQYLKRLRYDQLLRPLFRCSNDYVGAGWHGMQNGDEICILFGSNAPLILRDHGDHKGFIGDAYVPGIMNVGYKSMIRKSSC